MERIELEDYMLIEIGCSVCGVSASELTTKCKKQRFVDARFICFWLLYKYTDLSYRDIAHLFDLTDSSIAEGINKVKSRLVFKNTKEQTKLTKLAVMAGEIVSIIIKQKQHELDQKKSENSILCCNNSDGNSNTFSGKEVYYELTD